MRNTIRRAQHLLKKIAVKMSGYDQRNWLRVKQIDAFNNFLDLYPAAEVLEISPGWNNIWKNKILNYTSVDYPEFDICTDSLAREFDIVIADQVLEHVQKPVDAVRHMFAMVRPGGYIVVATPFLFRVHARPHDYYRWTEAGLMQLLRDGGFQEKHVQTFSWGNKSCARAHIGGPVRDYGWYRPMKNDPEYPLMVWAFAQKAL